MSRVLLLSAKEPCGASCIESALNPLAVLLSAVVLLEREAPLAVFWAGCVAIRVLRQRPVLWLHRAH